MKNDELNKLIDYIEKNKNLTPENRLPSNYITKKEAQKLGWKPKEGNLHEVAPGKTIGGDIYKNHPNIHNEKLPEKEGRTWHEADINHDNNSKFPFRGNERLLYSNDGLYYKSDHYKDFEKIRERNKEYNQLSKDNETFNIKEPVQNNQQKQHDFKPNEKEQANCNEHIRQSNILPENEQKEDQQKGWNKESNGWSKEYNRGWSKENKEKEDKER